jgi:hypothetical protein
MGLFDFSALPIFLPESFHWVTQSNQGSAEPHPTVFPRNSLRRAEGEYAALIAAKEITLGVGLALQDHAVESDGLFRIVRGS